MKYGEWGGVQDLQGVDGEPGRGARDVGLEEGAGDAEEESPGWISRSSVSVMRGSAVVQA